MAKAKKKAKSKARKQVAVRWAWRSGGRFAVRAEVAGASLDAIRRRDGSITPAAVVDAARDPDHPLHRAFDWDDGSASQKYRLLQARQLINSVRVVRDVGGPGQTAFVSVTVRETGRGYLPASVVMGDAEYRAESLAEALAALRGWRTRYAHLTELAEVFRVADRVGAAA